MDFSERDVEELSSLIGLIYDTVLDDSRWTEVLENVCRFVGGSASRIYWRDATNAAAETVHSWGFDPEFLDIYRRRYVSLNPLYPASVFIDPGQIFSTRNLVPPDEFQASRFFREWVLPQGFFDAAIFNIQRYQASAAAFTVITGRDYGASFFLDRPSRCARQVPDSFSIVGYETKPAFALTALNLALEPAACAIGQSDGRVSIGVQGATVEVSVAQGTPVDIGLTAFAARYATTTPIGHIPVHLTQLGDTTLELMVLRSYALSL